jgi:hypothetical protein
MQKSVQNVKNSLKFKVSPKSGILSVKVGVKKFALPVDARMLSNGDYLFLSFTASSELYTIDCKELKAMPSEVDATPAFQALNPSKRRGRRRREQMQMPADLAEALKGLPAGYKLGYNADGTPKLVRVRTRKKSSQK